MAKVLNIDLDGNRKELNVSLQKAVQSANLNFLIGSGCSFPVIQTLGNIEQDIQKFYEQNNDDEAEQKLFKYLKPFLESCQQVIEDSDDDKHKKTLTGYQDFLAAISLLLFERKSTILLKQAAIFTTNYDLFFEKASESFAGRLKLNDGFDRNPVLSNEFTFSTSEFFNATYNHGNLYNYHVEIPSINLLKLHGSLTWMRQTDQITFSVNHLQTALEEYRAIDATTEDQTEIKRKFNKQFPIVLPTKEKFKDTLLNQTYYDLLRIFSNELDKENTLLIAEGFSFEDEHIFDVTKRALRNPTLKLIVFCYDQKKELEGYKNKFSTYNNVDIVCSDSDLGFTQFVKIIADVLPQEPVNEKDETKEASEDDPETQKDVADE